MALEGRFTEAADAMSFMLAGSAVVTLVSVRSGKRYTYRVSRPRDEEERGNVPSKFFVGLLSGPDNESDYTYLGMIAGGAFRLTRASKLTADSAPVKAFSWAYQKLNAGLIPAELEVWHEGRCGRCGRTLTVPESVATGFGPECSAKLMINRVQVPRPAAPAKPVQRAESSRTAEPEPEPAESEEAEREGRTAEVRPLNLTRRITLKTPRRRRGEAEEVRKLRPVPARPPAVLERDAARFGKTVNEWFDVTSSMSQKEYSDWVAYLERIGAERAAGN